jgi:hypothetical protein
MAGTFRMPPMSNSGAYHITDSFPSVTHPC